MPVWEWVKSLSVAKLIILGMSSIIFVDMSLYYFSALIGRPIAPYPFLYEIISLLKEVHIGPDVN